MKIIGHAQVLAVLERARTAGRLAHGLCFVGPESVGKRTVATSLAAEILKTETPERHPDFFALARDRDEKTGVAKQEISVEQVRRLREQLSQTSFFSGPKVAVIDEAETLSTAASNALLKTLEEPPGATTIVLIATSFEHLPATVASRVQVFRFGTVSVEEMVRSGIEERFARLSAGRPGVASSLQDPDAYEKIQQDLAEFGELISAPVWRRAKIIETWFGKKKAHAEGAQELVERMRLWKTALREYPNMILARFLLAFSYGNTGKEKAAVEEMKAVAGESDSAYIRELAQIFLEADAAENKTGVGR